jgi:asparagine synthase (glutamine-hydrolysing)
MFAFGLWDETCEQLFVARDRIGIKPFHFYFDGERFLFASEIKGIITDQTVSREINPEALRHYFIYRYIPAPLTIWKNIQKLPPGTMLTFDGESLDRTRYWDLNEQLSESTPSEQEVTTQIQQILGDSVEKRLMSDVPLGALLSGGVDSSTVTAMMANVSEDVSTFSIGFDGSDDELPFAREVSNEFDTNHTEQVLSPEYMSSQLDKLLYHYDEPLGDSSIFPTFLLMDAVSDDVTVALSGDGGDEVFAGYSWYEQFYDCERFDPLSPLLGAGYQLVDKLSHTVSNRPIRFAKSHLRPFTASGFDRYRKTMAARFEEGEVRDILDDELAVQITGNTATFVDTNSPSTSEVKDLQYTDIHTFLPEDILVKVDRASMAHSLEVRVPLLDHRLLEYIMSLDSSVIYNGSEKKRLLKEVSRDQLSDSIIDRQKQGFSAPLESLNFFEEYEHVLHDSKAAADGILDQAAIDRFLSKDAGSNYGSANHWLLILFELWYQRWRAPE